MTEYMHRMLSQYIPNIFVHIFLPLSLTSINKLTMPRCSKFHHSIYRLAIEVVGRREKFVE